MIIWDFDWPYGRLEIQSLGGMLGPVEFISNSGKRIQPFHIAPWKEEIKDPYIPPILHRLRGEWPCVPFGSARSIKGLSSRWEPLHWEESEGLPHGYCSNEHWRLVEKNNQSIVIEIAYPDNNPIQSLKRIIKPNPKKPAIHLELHVQVRQNICLPIGLHPTFRLSTQPYTTNLQPGQFEYGLTFPGEFEPSACLLKPDSRFSSLDNITKYDGTTINLGKLPLENPTECLIQLCGIDGTFILNNTFDNYSVKLTWNKHHFPSCVLWISNYGRHYAPWNSKNLCVGIEPVNAAFDLGFHVSLADNPILTNGIPTYVNFTENQIWKTTYQIEIIHS